MCLLQVQGKKKKLKQIGYPSIILKKKKIALIIVFFRKKNMSWYLELSPLCQIYEPRSWLLKLFISKQENYMSKYSMFSAMTLKKQFYIKSIYFSILSILISIQMHPLSYWETLMSLSFNLLICNRDNISNRMKTDTRILCS